MFEYIVLGVLMCIFLFCVLMGGYRNNLVYKTRIDVLNLPGWQEYHKLPSYEKMLWDFSCWSVKQFCNKHGIENV